MRQIRERSREIREKFEEDLGEIRERFGRHSRNIRERFERDSRGIQERYERDSREIRERFRREPKTIKFQTSPTQPPTPSRKASTIDTREETAQQKKLKTPNKTIRITI